MERKIDPVIEGLYVGILFILLAFFTYSHYEQSISVIKYHLQFKAEVLLNNYTLYHLSFKDFFYQTAPLYRGIVAEQWYTFFYLTPLFVFCDLLGGLSLENICLFTITSSLIALALFYYWVRSLWGKSTALYATTLLGLSAIFQEIARSGSYIAGSLPIAMVWLLYFFHIVRFPPKKLVPYFLLGVLTGIIWNYYWLLKIFTIMAIAQQLFLTSYRRFAAQGAFFWGMEAIILPQIFIAFTHRTHFYLLLPRDEEVNKSLDLWQNLRAFWTNISGQNLLMEPGIEDRMHAHLWHPWLTILLFIGFIGTVWGAFQKRPAERWLLFLSALIYCTPLFFEFYGQARHSLFYIIPSYCFIGLGLNRIDQWIHNIPYKSIQILAVLPLLWAFYAISHTEMDMVQTHIVADKRDIGLLAFADGIKKRHMSGNLYYLEKNYSLYLTNHEFNVLRMALIENGTEPLNIKGGTLQSQSLFNSKSFYVVQSPNVPQEDFDAWSQSNHLKYSLLFQSPLMNAPRYISTSQPFKLYDVYVEDK